jgi:hypothetical protein
MTVDERFEELLAIVMREAEAEAVTETEELRVRWLAQAALRLEEIDKVLAREGVTVVGSKGQPRPHPLLGEEALLRREVDRGMSTLVRDVGRRARFERLRELTRDQGLLQRFSDKRLTTD